MASKPPNKAVNAVDERRMESSRWGESTVYFDSAGARSQARDASATRKRCRGGEQFQRSSRKRVGACKLTRVKAGSLSALAGVLVVVGACSSSSAPTSPPPAVVACSSASAPAGTDAFSL